MDEATADAVASAQQVLTHACAALTRAGGADRDRDRNLVIWAVRLLDAAGGPELGTWVRRHVEERGGAVVSRPGLSADVRTALLATAHDLATDTLAADWDRLRAAGLAGPPAAGGQTSARAAYVGQAVDARRTAVLTVLRAVT